MGDRIRGLRRVAGMNQKELASLLGIGQPALSAMDVLLGRDPQTGTPLTRHRHAHLISWSKNMPPWVDNLVGWGSLELMCRQLRAETGMSLPQLACSCNWISCMPYLAPRYVKPKGSNSLANQVAAECMSHGLPEPAKNDILDKNEVLKRRFHSYIRTRRPNRPQPPQTRPCCLRLTFPEEVCGPVALGYAAHYGLGLFAAED